MWGVGYTVHMNFNEKDSFKSLNYLHRNRVIMYFEEHRALSSKKKTLHQVPLGHYCTVPHRIVLGCITDDIKYSLFKGEFGSFLLIDDKTCVSTSLSIKFFKKNE